MVANDANGSGGSAVVKALRATEKRMEKTFPKNKKMNNSSTVFYHKTLKTNKNVIVFVKFFRTSYLWMFSV